MVNALGSKQTVADHRGAATVRGRILDEARRIITADRNRRFGEPEDLFDAVADMRGIIERLRRRGGHERDGRYAVLEEIALKLCRAAIDPDGRDHWVDLVGYAACGGELAARWTIEPAEPEADVAPDPVRPMVVPSEAAVSAKVTHSIVCDIPLDNGGPVHGTLVGPLVSTATQFGGTTITPVDGTVSPAHSRVEEAPPPPPAPAVAPPDDGPPPGASGGPWTEAEDDLLVAAMVESAGRSTNTVARDLITRKQLNRTAGAAAQRIRGHLNARIKAAMGKPERPAPAAPTPAPAKSATTVSGRLSPEQVVVKELDATAPGRLEPHA